MRFDAKRIGHLPGGQDFVSVALPILDRHRVQAEAHVTSDCRGCIGIEAAAQQNDRPRLRGHSLPRCACAAAIAGGPAGGPPGSILKILRIQDAVDRGEKDSLASTIERVPSNDIARELVVGAILDDELHLIAATEVFDVRPLHLVGFAAGWTLHVHHLHDCAWHTADVDLAARFQQDGTTAVKQPFHQGVHVLLEQRLSSSHLDQGLP